MLSRIRGVDLVVARAEPESVARSRGGHAEVLPLPLGSSMVACSVRLRVEAARFLMLNRPPPLLGDGAALLRSPDRRRRSGDCAEEELGAIRTCRARSAPGCRRGGGYLQRTRKEDTIRHERLGAKRTTRGPLVPSHRATRRATGHPHPAIAATAVATTRRAPNGSEHGSELQATETEKAGGATVLTHTAMPCTHTTTSSHRYAMYS